MIITSSPGIVHGGVWRHLSELTATTGITEYIQTQHLINNIPLGTRLIIFGGCWNPEYATVSKFARSHNIKVGLLHCSPFGQTDICREHQSMASSIDFIKFDIIDYLFTGDENMALFYKECLGENTRDKIHFLPQTMDYERFKLADMKKSDVGLFCGNMPNKNILNQIIGVRLSGKKLLTNVFDRKFEMLANELGLNYESYGWMTDEDYYGTLQKCKVGLQASWSESFDYVAAEMSLMGIPVITTPTIYWNLEELKLKNADNPYEIASKINEVYDKNWSRNVRSNIVKELEKRKKIARDLMKKLVYEEI